MWTASRRARVAGQAFPLRKHDQSHCCRDESNLYWILQ